MKKLSFLAFLILGFASMTLFNLADACENICIGNRVLYDSGSLMREYEREPVEFESKVVHVLRAWLFRGNTGEALKGEEWKAGQRFCTKKGKNHSDFMKEFLELEESDSVDIHKRKKLFEDRFNEIRRALVWLLVRSEEDACRDCGTSRAKDEKRLGYLRDCSQGCKKHYDVPLKPEDRTGDFSARDIVNLAKYFEEISDDDRKAWVLYNDSYFYPQSPPITSTSMIGEIDDIELCKHGLPRDQYRDLRSFYRYDLKDTVIYRLKTKEKRDARLKDNSCCVIL